MSFIDEYRQSVDADRKEKAATEKALKGFNGAIEDYVTGYQEWAQKNNGKFSESKKEDLIARIKDMARKAGEYDGVLKKESSDREIAEYGEKFIRDLTGRNDNNEKMSFKDYLTLWGKDDEKDAYRRQENRENNPFSKYQKKDNSTVRENPFERQVREQREQDEGILSKAKEDYNKFYSQWDKDSYSMFENYEDFYKKKGTKESTEKASTTTKTTSDGETTTTSDTVTFTLPRANDPNYRGFGQKIVDLGLATDNGLWGSNGDVQFYTKQLYEQGALDKNGNLKIGVPIKLRRRK